MLVAPWGFGAQLVFRGSAWCTLRVLESLWRFLTPLDTLGGLLCEKKGLQKTVPWCLWNCNSLRRGVSVLARKWKHPYLGQKSKMSSLMICDGFICISWFIMNMQVIWLKLFVFDSSSDCTHHGPCNEGKEGGNEGHERSEGHDQGSAFGWVGQCDWDEEGRHQQSLELIDWDRHRGGEEVWQVRSPWLVHDQDSHKGSCQRRRHSDDVWERSEDKATAREDCREGISSFSTQKSNLRPWLIRHVRPWSCSQRMLVAPWGFGAQLVFRGSAWCTLRVLESLWRFLTPLDTLGGLLCEKKGLQRTGPWYPRSCNLLYLLLGLVAMMPVKGQGVMLHKFVASKIVGGRGYKHGGQRDIYPEGGGATFAHKFTWQIPPKKRTNPRIKRELLSWHFWLIICWQP